MSDAIDSSLLNSVFEKRTSVFFAVKPDGVMLHNYAVGRFMDLNKHEEVLWKYCDGTMTLAEVIDRVLTTAGESQPTLHKESLRDLATRLVEEGFLCRRDDHAN